MHGVLPQDSNWITDVTHSPMYPLVVLTVYLFGIGFTIGNYVGYFRLNKTLYGDDFVRAYLAFTIIGAGAYFFVSSVAWLWGAKYVSSVDSRIRKLTAGFVSIFLFHDLPCFSMELHAILGHGWRNGYQGFVFVVQILTFLLSFINGWLYYTWVMAGWLQYWYGDVSETYELKTGAEQLQILPPMSPVLRTPMLQGPGLRWSNTNNNNINSNGTGGGGGSGGNYPSTLAAQRSQMSSPRAGSYPAGTPSAAGVSVGSGGGPNSVLRRMQSGGMVSSPVHSQAGSRAPSSVGLAAAVAPGPLRPTRTVRPVGMLGGLEAHDGDGLRDDGYDDEYAAAAPAHLSGGGGGGGGIAFYTGRGGEYAGAGPSPPSLMRSGLPSPRAGQQQQQQYQQQHGLGLSGSASNFGQSPSSAFSGGGGSQQNASPLHHQSNGGQLFQLDLKPLTVSRSPASASWKQLAQL